MINRNTATVEYNGLVYTVDGYMQFQAEGQTTLFGLYLLKCPKEAPLLVNKDLSVVYEVDTDWEDLFNGMAKLLVGNPPVLKECNTSKPNWDYANQVDMYRTLKKANDPLVLAAEYMLDGLQKHVCHKCGMADRCPAAKSMIPDTKCPAGAAILGMMKSRSDFVQNTEPWIGVDLDGTLTKEMGDKFDPLSFGEPIQPMIDLVKSLLEKGVKVKVFTARVARNNPNVTGVHRAIRKWTKEHIGKSLEATAEKDYMCVGFFDDRAHQVVRDNGILLESVFQKQTDTLAAYNQAFFGGLLGEADYIKNLPYNREAAQQN